MKKKNRLVIVIAIALILPVVIMMMAMSRIRSNVIPPRPDGPRDIYAAINSKWNFKAP